MSDILTTVLLSAVPTILVMGLLYACALGHAAWRLWHSAEERAWWQCLRASRRARRARDLEAARQRGELHPLWTRRDGPYVLGLLGVAALVMALCR